MTRSFFFISVAFTILSCSHSQKLDGNYFSDQQDCLSFGDEKGYIETFEKGVKGLRIKQKEHKLKFREWRPSPHGIFRGRFYKYYFRVLIRNDDMIMVSPKSKLAKEYFAHRDSIVLKTKYAYADRTINFEKIVYHASQCGWFCPDLHMELDNAGNIKLTDNGNGRTDTVKNKNYRGVISANELERLKTILTYAQLKTVKWNDDHEISDVSTITMIIYYNGKRLYLKSRSLPIVSWELANYLYRLSYRKDFPGVNETFEYEQ